MKKTYVTTMPDHIGAFLKASRCFAGLDMIIKPDIVVGDDLLKMRLIVGIAHQIAQFHIVGSGKAEGMRAAKRV